MVIFLAVACQCLDALWVVYQLVAISTFIKCSLVWVVEMALLKTFWPDEIHVSLFLMFSGIFFSITGGDCFVGGHIVIWCQVS